ncbi:hypothetical protein [Candidatus Magnetobacterium casense]|uniref:Uncharacterized protein n=1 Tax=Candidatus Magnetobacterium casense TaxID=1455061 RepID=A0ABS6RVT1_9BACT|nr:hypothetical protein [Candidatus Magnetobacterium casensis]MBV6340552.1 hypothetical protein [Candidatus Magnetobacterium casensis]
MKHIRDLKAQASVAIIVPMLLAVSIIFGMGYLLLSKTPHVQALVYVPALITLGSCVLYFWLTVLDNNQTKQQISEYLRLMNHHPSSGMESQVQAESDAEAESDAQTNLAYLQASLETIIALLEQSNRLAAGAVNKELILSVCETIDEGLKKHANTVHRSNSQHVENLISNITEIFFTNLKPGIDAIVCGLNRTDDKQTDSQSTIRQLVSAIDGMKSFKDDIVVELARLPEALNAIPLQYSQDIKSVIEQLQLLPEQMRSTYTKLTTYLSSAINEIQGLYADGFEQISKLSAHGTMAQENLEKLIERINAAIEKQLDTFNDGARAAHLVSETASALATTSADIRLLTDGLIKSADSHERLCVNFNDLFKETEGISRLNSQVLEKQQSTFREFQDAIEKVLTNLVHQTDVFTGRTTEGLRQFIDDIVSSLSKTSGTMENQRTRLLEWTDSIDQHMDKLSCHSALTQENFERLMSGITNAVDKQADTLKDTTQVVERIKESVALLATASGDISLLTDGLIKSMDSHDRLYVSFNDLFRETEGISKLNSQLFEKHQATFKELEGTIEKVLTNLVHQADVFTGRTTDGLRQFIDDIVSSLSKTAGTMENQHARLLEWTDSIDQHMGKFSTHSALTQENFERLMSGITNAVDKQADTLKDSAQVVGLIKESVALLATVSGDISLLTDGLVKSTDSHDRLYVSFNDLFRETEGISKLNSQLFEKHQATFRELEGTIEKVLTNLVHQADVFTGRTTDGLRQFIDDIVSSLSKTTDTMENQHTRLLEWTNSIDQHVGRLSIHSALTQENFERLMTIITNAVDKQADTLKDSAQVVERIKESADLLVTASGDVRLLADGLTKSTDSQQRLCVNFNDLFKETEGISKLNSQLFEKHQATFKELEGIIEKALTNLVHQADVFTGRATEGLRQFIDDIVSSLSKTAGTMENQHTRLLEWTNSIDQHVGKLSTHSALTQENFERLMSGITNAIDKQADTLKDSARVVGLIKESAALLAIASGDVRLLTDGLAKSTGSQERLYVNFNDLFKEIEGISKLNSRLLEKQQATFKELEGTIEKVMTNLVVQTDVFTVRTTDGLKQFIDDITSNLSKTSGSIDNQTAKFMDWTSSIEQHISKLSTHHTVSQDGLKQLVNLINSSIERQNNTLEKSSKLVSLIKESAVLLATASTGVKHLTEGLIKSADTHEKLYANFNNLLKEVDGKSKLNTQLLEHERDAFKELGTTVEKLLFNLVKQTDVFTGRTTDGLTRFINDINAGLSESVNSLRGVIHVQTELVDEISSTLVQLNDKLKG